jgi:hypothetical protein
MAWIPYGVVHYVSPVVVSGCMFIWGPPGTLPAWARAFGYMNLTAVIVQIVFPCSPPWYESTYGLTTPANYSIPGDAAGLKAIDKLFGNDFWSSTFHASPLVFGAFPSLHSGWATLEALFMGHVFPNLFPVYIFYTMWLWWSAMYFSHHYVIDLVGGSLCKSVTVIKHLLLLTVTVAGFAYFWARAEVLPRMQPDKEFRWDYDYVENGDVQVEEFTLQSDSNYWTKSSSSSYSISGRSPAGACSPVDDAQSLWDGETVGPDIEPSHSPPTASPHLLVHNLACHLDMITSLNNPHTNRSLYKYS